MRGATLLELLIGLGLMSVIAAVGVPGLIGFRDRLVVERHASRLVQAYDAARSAALLSGNAVVLIVEASRIRVARLEGGDTIPVWEADGPATDGVRLTTSHRLIAVGPHGLSFGLANGRFELRRGQVIRAVVASRPGRLRVERQPRRRRRREGPRAPRYPRAS